MSIEIASITKSAASVSNVELELKTVDVADPNDVHAFESALHHDPFAEGIMSKVESVSGSLSEMKVDFEKSLKRASETADSTAILESMRMLSDYTLQTSMIAKAAGKTSQAVDKLTNLH